LLLLSKQYTGINYTGIN